MTTIQQVVSPPLLRPMTSRVLTANSREQRLWTGEVQTVRGFTKQVKISLQMRSYNEYGEHCRCEIGPFDETMSKFQESVPAEIDSEANITWARRVCGIGLWQGT